MSDDQQVPHRVAVGDLRRLRLSVPLPVPFTGAGVEYRRRLADLVDAALSGLWREALTAAGLVGPGQWSDGGANAPDADGRHPSVMPRGIALAVVGSQGRRDAGPLSDLDLLLVHDGSSHSAEQLSVLADRLWYPLWDAGVDLDHSVRSIAECRKVATADLVSAIGLLDIRHVAGDPAVVDMARTALRADWRSAARTRLGTLVDSVAERAARHGELAYLIEPDLKEARGGLRDAVVISALVASWLVERPNTGESDAYGRLLDVRDALAHTTGRPALRLGRADALDLAPLLGFDHPDDLLAMLAQEARTISAALDVAIRYARRAQRRPDRLLTRPWIVRGRRLPRRLPEVGEGLAVLADELVLAAGVDPSLSAELPLRAAATAARHQLPISPVTLHNLGRAPGLPAPWPAASLADLLSLLGSGQAQIPVWEACDLAGLVVSWIPEWAAVRNRPQRSPVHRHTVDRHLVQTAANTADLLTRTQIGGIPVDLDDEQRDAVLLAALLHDIGKVAGAEDHSSRGAEIAPAVLSRMGASAATNDLVTRLIREHLTLAEAATTQDPEDFQTIRRTAAAVNGDRATLVALRLLTEADASAAGPQAWTSWRAALVDTLTRGVHTHLESSPAR